MVNSVVTSSPLENVAIMTNGYIRAYAKNVVLRVEITYKK